ncbi:hypothetical protein GOBAR_DD36312 [Gossypium barbadense]|nr:hypothetical protein GOBAR_DD36312 [Gossypium barbadense]
MSNNFFAIVYYDGKISKSDTDVVFESDDPISLTFIKDITLEEMKCKINRKIGAGNTKTISSLNTKIYGNVALELYVELEDVEKGCRDVNVPASNPEIQPIRQCEAEIPSSSQVATEAAIDLNIVPFGESYVFEEYENEDEDEEDRDSDVEIIPAPETGDLCIGKRFPTKGAVLSAIKHYNIKQSVDYKVIVPTPTKYVGFDGIIMFPILHVRPFEPLCFAMSSI